MTYFAIAPAAVAATHQLLDRGGSDFQKQGFVILGGKGSTGRFRLRLLGPMQLWDPDGLEVTPRGAKAQGLLAILAMAEGAPCHRSFLQDKLWSDREHKQGRDSLKKALAEVRQCFGDRADRVMPASPGAVTLMQDLLATDVAEPELFPGKPLIQPAFLEGIDIRDDEFNTWLSSVRVALSEALVPEPNQHVLRTAKVAAPDERVPPCRADRLGIAVLPVQRVETGEPSSFLGDLLMTRIVNGLRSFDICTFYDFRDQEPPESNRPVAMTLEASILVIGEEANFTLALRRAGSGAILWSAARVLSLRALNDAVISPVVSQLSDEVALALGRPGLLGDPDEARASSLLLGGIDQIFRLGGSNLTAAAEALDQAIAIDPKGSYFAWKAFLTAFRLEESKGKNVGELHEEARAASAEAIRHDPHNPLVIALVTHVNAFVLRDFTRAFTVIDSASCSSLDNAMFEDSLAMLHFYTGNLVKAEHHARRAALAGRSNLFRYSFETSLCMVNAVSGNLGQAISHGERAIAMQSTSGPLFEPTLRYLMAAYAHQGDLDDAERIMDLIHRQNPGFSAKALSEVEFPVPSQQPRDFLLQGIKLVEKYVRNKQ